MTICPVCEFEHERKKGTYCSMACKQRGYRARVDVGDDDWLVYVADRVSKSVVTPEQRTEIRIRFERGENDTQIRQALGMSMDMVRVIRSRMGLTRFNQGVWGPERPAKQRVSDKRIAQAYAGRRYD